MASPQTSTSPQGPPHTQAPVLLKNPWDVVESNMYSVLASAKLYTDGLPATSTAQSVNAPFTSNQPQVGEGKYKELPWPGNFVWEFWNVASRFAEEASHERPSHDGVMEVPEAFQNLPEQLGGGLEHWGCRKAWNGFLARLTQEEFADWCRVGRAALHAALEAEPSPTATFEEEELQVDSEIQRALMWLEIWAKSIER